MSNIDIPPDPGALGRLRAAAIEAAREYKSARERLDAADRNYQAKRATAAVTHDAYMQAINHDLDWQADRDTP